MITTSERLAPVMKPPASTMALQRIDVAGHVVDAGLADLAADEHLQRLSLDHHLDLRPQQLAGVGRGERLLQFVGVAGQRPSAAASSGSMMRPSGCTVTVLFSSGAEGMTTSSSSPG